MQILLLILFVIWSHLCCLKKTFFKNPFSLYFFDPPNGLKKWNVSCTLFLSIFIVVVIYQTRIFAFKSLSEFKTPIFATMRVISGLGVFPYTNFHFLYLVTLSSSNVEHWVNQDDSGGWVIYEEVFLHE